MALAQATPIRPVNAGQRYVSSPARTHLEAWLAAAGITQGPIFARLNRNGAPLTPAIHANEVARIFKDVARRAGFAEPEVRRIAAQSIRIARHMPSQKAASPC